MTEHLLPSLISEKYNVKQTSPFQVMWNWTNRAISHFSLLKTYGNIHGSTVLWIPRNLDKGFFGTDQREDGVTENLFFLQQCTMQLLSERTQVVSNFGGKKRKWKRKS